MKLADEQSCSSKAQSMFEAPKPESPAVSAKSETAPSITEDLNFSLAYNFLKALPVENQIKIVQTVSSEYADQDRSCRQRVQAQIKQLGEDLKKRDVPKTQQFVGSGPWTPEEIERFNEGVRQFGKNRGQIARHIGTKQYYEVNNRIASIKNRCLKDQGSALDKELYEKLFK